MTTSALDGVAGLGETRKKALLRHFGSLKRLETATLDEVMEVPGIGRRRPRRSPRPSARGGAAATGHAGPPRVPGDRRDGGAHAVPGAPDRGSPGARGRIA